MSTRPSLLLGEDLPPKPSQKRSQEKRARLKAAGLALFCEKGYERTSIDEIASKAHLAVGSFYQHFRSKRQLLLSLMDEFLENLNQLDFRPQSASNIKENIRAFLSRALSTDLHYLGAYRAWQEAVISDPELALKETEIRAWTTSRVFAIFSLLQQLPGARRGVDIQMLAQVMDSFFWNLMAQIVGLSHVQQSAWIDSSAHIVYYALFTDVPSQAAHHT